MDYIFSGLISLASVIGLGGASSMPMQEAQQIGQAKIERILNHPGNNIAFAQNWQEELRNKILRQAAGVQIEEGYLNEIIQKTINQAVTGSENITSTMLPEDMQHLNGKVFHLPIDCQRDNWSCGYWTVFMAEAISHCLENEIELSFTNIRNRAIQNWARFTERIGRDIPRGVIEAERLNHVALHLRNNNDARFNNQNFTEIINSFYDRFLEHQDNGVPEEHQDYDFRNNIYILQPHAGNDHVREELLPAHVQGGNTINQMILNQTLINTLKPEFQDEVNFARENGQELDWPAHYFYQEGDLLPDGAILQNNVRAKTQIHNQHFLRQLRNHFFRNNLRTMHFACHATTDGGVLHWILISIIKLPDSPSPFILVLDSIPFELQESYKRHIQVLYDLFIANQPV